MNSIHRERFQLCMEHRESDKIPTDIWIDSNDPKVKERLIRETGCSSYEELLDYLDIDICRFKPKPRGYTGKQDDLTDFFLPTPDVRYLSFSNTSVRRPLIDVEEPEELNRFHWPDGGIFDYSNMPDILENQKHRVLWAQAGTWSPVFCKMCDLCGMEKVLMDLLLNPELISAMIERIVAFYKDSFTRTLEASKGRLDVFGFGDDFATQQGLMFSRELWRQYFKKPMRELCDLIHSYGVLVAFHSCGAVESVIPDFIDVGVDIVFPIQPRAKNMQPEHLKQKYGNNIVFYGGIDVQNLLPFGSVMDVQSEVNRVCSILGKNGGYIAASSHGIMSDVPTQNVIAMYEAVNQIKCIY